MIRRGSHDVTQKQISKVAKGETHVSVTRDKRAVETYCCSFKRCPRLASLVRSVGGVRVDGEVRGGVVEVVWTGWRGE